VCVQDVLLHRKCNLAKGFATWKQNHRRQQQLVRISAHIQALGLYRRVSRAFRHWRVLEREYCAWHRGFAASYEIGLLYFPFLP